MAAGVRYCESCWTEFVDGVQRCSDCGGPLLDGDLPRERPRDAEEAPFTTISADPAAIDSLAAEMPGEDAEHFAEALKIEGIVSRLECGNLVRYRGPGQKATGMISLREPVQVFVAAKDLDVARDILETISRGDLIGDAWTEGSGEVDVEDSDLLWTVPSESDAAPPNLQPEGTSSGSLVALVLAVAVGMLFLFVFGRG